MTFHLFLSPASMHVHAHVDTHTHAHMHTAAFPIRPCKFLQGQDEML